MFVQMNLVNSSITNTPARAYNDPLLCKLYYTPHVSITYICMRCADVCVRVCLCALLNCRIGYWQWQ